jgi:hypothetical protein
MWLRVLSIVGCVACASGPPHRLRIQDPYEVGEDPTILVESRASSSEDAMLVIARPGGSTVQQRVALRAPQTHVRFNANAPVTSGREPTFTEIGDYRVELRVDQTVLARQEIRISLDRLTTIFGGEEIASFAPVTRYARARQYRQQHWKSYGALFEHTLRPGTQIHVLIEEPDDALRDAWKDYEEEGTLGVIENHNVRFRERAGSVSASWISGTRIVAMRAAVLADFERGFIAHFLARYPSSL